MTTMTMLIELPEVFVAKLPALRKANPGCTDPEIVASAIAAAVEHHNRVQALTPQERTALAEDDRPLVTCTVRQLARLLGVDNAMLARAAAADAAREHAAAAAAADRVFKDVRGLRSQMVTPARLRTPEERERFFKAAMDAPPNADLVILAAWADHDGYFTPCPAPGKRAN